MKLNEKIVFCRKKCGISQEALGEKIGVSRQAVSKWETGEALPEITNLKALAVVFGVTVDFLLDDDDGANDNNGQRGSSAEGSSGSGSAAHFIKKYGWIGGIILLIFGAYKTLTLLFSFVTSLDTAAQLSRAGIGSAAVIPTVLIPLLNLLLAAALTAAGIVIIKKFRPRSEQKD
ncbi:MAG: helix-turn-helix transcriptional regulator [Oscillospiraceae bacterium]|nr:helix-turn-helix transcriptional regulator [Oscillospiraceae bacterium]